MATRFVFALLALAVVCQATRLHSRRGLLAKKRVYANLKRQVTDELIVATPGTAAEGALLSPGYPDGYSNYVDQGWLITAPPGMTLSVLFTGFSLEAHYSCSWDSVNLFDGANAEAAPLTTGPLCGNAGYNMELTTTGNELYVLMHTDCSVTAAGFEMRWVITGEAELPEVPPSACPGPLEVTEAGTIESTNYGIGDYGNNANCRWEITAPEGQVVLLTFNMFQVEFAWGCMYDVLKVFDGTGTEVPELAELCGSELPAPILSTGNTMSLMFGTDSCVTLPGFSIEVLFLAEGTALEDVLPADALSLCATGDIELSEEGLIETPNLETGEETYADNEQYCWTIEAPEGKVVKLEFMTFHLESAGGCIYDALRIYDGSNAVAPLMANLCGLMNVPDIYSTGNAMYLYFTSDYSVTYPGFSISFTFIDPADIELEPIVSPALACPGPAQVDGSMIITTPNYGLGEYANEETCQWRITNPAGTPMWLYFESFSVEYAQDCIYDALEVYDGEDDTAELVASLCGHYLPAPILSSGASLYLVFTSDSSVPAPGFRAEVITNLTAVPPMPPMPEIPEGSEFPWGSGDFPGGLPNAPIPSPMPQNQLRRNAVNRKLELLREEEEEEEEKRGKMETKRRPVDFLKRKLEERRPTPVKRRPAGARRFH